MSSRYLIPLAVAAALAAPVAAHAEDGTYDPGKWLFRVGLSQINPDIGQPRRLRRSAAASRRRQRHLADRDCRVHDHARTSAPNCWLAWPFTHGIDLKIAGGDRSTASRNVDVLPPTLSLNWHFNPNGMFRPYIGVGVNYTLFSGEETRGRARRHRA